MTWSETGFGDEAAWGVEGEQGPVEADEAEADEAEEDGGLSLC